MKMLRNKFYSKNNNKQNNYNKYSIKIKNNSKNTNKNNIIALIVNKFIAENVYNDIIALKANIKNNICANMLSVKKQNSSKNNSNINIVQENGSQASKQDREQVDSQNYNQIANSPSLDFPLAKERKGLIKKLLNLCESAYGAVYGGKKEAEEIALSVDHRGVMDYQQSKKSDLITDWERKKQADSGIDSRASEKFQQLKANYEWSCKDGTPLRAVLEIGELVHKLFVAEEKIYHDRIKAQMQYGSKEEAKADDGLSAKALRQAGVIDEQEFGILENFLERRSRKTK